MDAIRDIHLRDALDILLVAGVVWAGLYWLRSRAQLFLVALVMLGGISLVARQVGLQLTAWALQAFFILAVVVVVVAFQDDLRRFVEQLGRATLRSRLRQRRSPSYVRDAVLRSVARLAGARHGALLLIPGHDPLDRHLEGGVALDGRVSEVLLLSLFDPTSPGHDGALLLDGDRVVRFGIHLPLSTDHLQLGSVGTRHAAALGLAERSDALCIVVSEERGAISVARDGRLRLLEHPEQLEAELRAFRRSLAPSPPEPGRWPRFLRARWPEAAQALAIAVILWAVFVPGSSMTQATRRAPVLVDNLPMGFELETIEPAEIEVTISGRRRDVYLTAPDDLEVHVDALLAEQGRRTFEVSTENVRHSREIDVREVQPDRIKLSLRPVPREGDS